MVRSISACGPARHRGWLLTALVVLGWCSTSGLARSEEAHAAALQGGDVGTERYVGVRLDGYANDLLATSFSGTRITVRGVPFDLIASRAANHVFLRDLGWADWREDPSAYYSAYDLRPAAGDRQRMVLTVPVADYTAAYLLAATDDDPGYAPVVSLRLGALASGSGDQVRYHDFSAMVPRLGESGGDQPAVGVPGGRLFLVRIPLAQAIAQDFAGRPSLDVDVTKELRLAIRRPDPCRFQIRPLGLPSGVRLFGLTFERAPVQMEVQGTAPGQVFNEPETPAFRVTLSPISTAPGRCSLEAVATHYHGEVSRFAGPEVALPLAGGKTAVELRVPVRTRGHYELEVHLRLDGRQVLTRRTSFALLPPDTRRYREQSPFGTWDFSGGHFTPSDPELLGPLYVKAGLRYGMFGQPDDVRRRYGVVKGNDGKLDSAAVAELAEEVGRSPGAAPPARLMVFHETVLSGPHVSRLPSLFTGRAYRFSADEEQAFQRLWREAETTAQAIRRHFPDTEIYFGNGNPQLLEAFLRRGFPKELLGSRGNEAGNFMRPPEAQPPDWVSNGAGLWMDRQLLDGYGYRDTPLRQCYEMVYPGTNPGNLSLRTQAEYYVRHMMHSLVWEIPIIRSLLITDVGNSYYFSNWGAAGLCHQQPDVRPKPAYVACATLTLVLDGARFRRVVPCRSPVVYAVEFERPDRSYVTCLWTLRGTRPLGVRTAGRAAVWVTDLMGNIRAAEGAGDTAIVGLSTEPVFLTTAAPVVELVPGDPVLPGRPTGRSFVVADLGTAAGWSVETERSRELEAYSFMSPRRPGRFDYTAMDSFEGEAGVLRVAPGPTAAGPELLPVYSVLRLDPAVELPGEPTEIGVMVNGNGGWGRILFELEDAVGQRWVSMGAEQAGPPSAWMADWMPAEEFARLKTANQNDWNTDDPWGRSAINFEGWSYLRFPLPGNYPGERYHWPYSSQWYCSGDGIVRYPLRFRKLIVALPEKALHLREYRAVPRPEIYLKDLLVTYQPPEVAFAAP